MREESEGVGGRGGGGGEGGEGRGEGCECFGSVETDLLCSGGRPAAQMQHVECGEGSSNATTPRRATAATTTGKLPATPR